MEYLMSEQHTGNTSARYKQKQHKILVCYEKRVFGQRGREVVIKSGQKKYNLCTGIRQKRTECN